jgi:hypothetical protein
MFHRFISGFRQGKSWNWNPELDTYILRLVFEQIESGFRYRTFDYLLDLFMPHD